MGTPINECGDANQASTLGGQPARGWPSLVVLPSSPLTRVALAMTRAARSRGGVTVWILTRATSSTSFRAPALLDGADAPDATDEA